MTRTWRASSRRRSSSVSASGSSRHRDRRGIGIVAAFVIGAPGVVVLIAGGALAIVAVAMRLIVVLIVGAVHRPSGPTAADVMPEGAATNPAR